MFARQHGAAVGYFGPKSVALLQIWRQLPFQLGQLEHGICVRFELALHPMTHVVQVDAHTFPTGKFEGRNHVAVACYDDDNVHESAKR